MQTAPSDNIENRLKELFDDSLWEQPHWPMLVEIFRQCILGKVHPAEAPLQRQWIAPGEYYHGQWIWDTMFVLDLLTLLPDTRNLVRDVFQNFWDFQSRWNAASPPHAQGMIACFLEPGKDNWLQFPAYSQIPMLAWGLERVFLRARDLELVRSSLQPLEQFHDWYWRERDVRDQGLVSVGAYSGDLQHARFETFDFEANLDDLGLTPHPMRDADNGSWYGDICVPGLTSYLVLNERSLARLADAAGDPAMAARRRARAERGADALRARMWDEAAGTFLAVHRDTGEKIATATIGSWMPLLASVPTREQAQRMADTLSSPNWMTPLPVPTVGRHDPHWNDGKFAHIGSTGDMWRGDVWPPTNYQIALGLQQCGHVELAAQIADRTIANALVHGVNEKYHCDTGQPQGVPFLGMSCTLVTMMLDGLSQTYAAPLKSQPNA